MKGRGLKRKWLSIVLIVALVALLMPLFAKAHPVTASSPSPPDFDLEHRAYQKIFDQYSLVDVDEVHYLSPGDTCLLRTGSSSIWRPNMEETVGRAAWELGVRAYNVSRSQDGLLINFRHIVNSKQGTLIIRRAGTGNQISLELQRNDETLAVSWDREVGEFILLDGEEQIADFWIKELEWISDDEAAWQILDRFESDIELMAAIALDFSSEYSASETGDRFGECKEVSSGSIYSIDCDYSFDVRGHCVGDSRSGACWCAKNDANYQCNNSACWGCCDWLSQDCDCACLVGDYFCSCGITGFPCTVN
jgi:hypothetical protein